MIQLRECDRCHTEVVQLMRRDKVLCDYCEEYRELKEKAREKKPSECLRCGKELIRLKGGNCYFCFEKFGLDEDAYRKAWKESSRTSYPMGLFKSLLWGRFSATGTQVGDYDSLSQALTTILHELKIFHGAQGIDARHLKRWMEGKDDD